MEGNSSNVTIRSEEPSRNAGDQLEPKRSRHQSASVGQLNACQECESLKRRVGRLEQLCAEFAAGQSTAPAVQFGTVACYWTVVGLHSFALLCMLSSVAALLAYPFLWGAIGTLAACHALPIRPILLRWLRTLLSISVVGLPAMLPLGLLGALDADYLSAVLLIYFPLVFLPALFGAQLLIWIVGWRVQPPGTRLADQPRFRILDMMGFTILAAVYAALFKFTNMEDLNIDLADGGWSYLGATLVMSTLIGIVASACARSFLADGSRVSKIWLFYAALAALVSWSALVSVFVGLGGDWAFSVDELLSVLLYAVGGPVVCLISPVVTFVLMRLAGYRMAFPRANLGILQAKLLAK